MRRSISVVMTTYNGARYIEEQLESIARQTLLPDELIIADDGSSDATLAVARAFQSRSPFPIRIVENDKRLGFSDNFLNAAELVENEFVAFCDQDDVWLPQKLQVSLTRMMDDDSDISLHTLILTDEKLRRIGVARQDIRQDILFGPLELNPYRTGWGNSMLVRRRLFHLMPRHGRPFEPGSHDKKLSHDHWVYTLGAAIGSVSHIDEPLILYRQHDRNVYGTTPEKPRPLAEFLGRFRVPLTTYREQAEFYRRIADIFSVMSDDLVDKAVLEKAAGKYRERQLFEETRTSIFTDKKLGQRIAAFRRLRRLPTERIDGFVAKAKEMILGVGQAHRLIR